MVHGMDHIMIVVDIHGHKPDPNWLEPDELTFQEVHKHKKNVRAKYETVSPPNAAAI